MFEELGRGSPGVPGAKWWSQQPSIMLDWAGQLKRVDLVELRPWMTPTGLLWTHTPSVLTTVGRSSVV